MAVESVLELIDLSAGYERRRSAREVLSQVNVRFHAGELVCLVGPNGSGKSTLLRAVSGLLPPLRGQVLLDRRDICALTPRERAGRMALVITQLPRVPGMTGRHLVALGRSPHTGWLGLQDERDREIVEEALRATDCLFLAERFLDALSDGERQRLAIARALAQEAQVLLLDEPTAFLDMIHRVQLFAFLRELAARQQRIVLLSTHDLELALRFADRVALLDSGRVICDLPEMLVLNGEIERVFAGKGIVFDRLSGILRWDSASGRRVAFSRPGDDVRAFWTARALERRGWSLTDQGFPRVECLNIEGKPGWRVWFDAERQKETHSLETLLKWLA